MDDREIDARLDGILEREAQLARSLTVALQEKDAWDAFVAELRRQALVLGKDAVANALPFVAAALKVAVLA